MIINEENMALIIQDELNELEEKIKHLFTIENRSIAMQKIKKTIIETFNEENTKMLDAVSEHLTDYASIQQELEATLIMVENLEDKIKKGEQQ